jgi:hypothetical protein
MKFVELVESYLKPEISTSKIAKKHKISEKEVEKLLKAGTRVEKEHTTNTKVARTIASHHIYELKDYYDKLKKVEKNK